MAFWENIEKSGDWDIVTTTGFWRWISPQTSRRRTSHIYFNKSLWAVRLGWLQDLSIVTSDAYVQKLGISRQQHLASTCFFVYHLAGRKFAYATKTASLKTMTEMAAIQVSALVTISDDSVTRDSNIFYWLSCLHQTKLKSSPIKPERSLFSRQLWGTSKTQNKPKVNKFRRILIFL